MSARLVAQIESLIARLTAARNILASLEPDQPIHSALPSAERVVTMQPREADEVEARQVAATPVQVTMLKPRVRRERRTPPRPLSTSAPTALAGSIPEKPVVVSPRQLAEARESRIPEETKGMAAPHSAIEELMLEIAQRSA